MHLVEILLPLYDNDGRAFPREEFDRVRRELTDEFGGVTAFLRSPAEGAWKEDAGRVSHDRIVIFEVMIKTLEHDWWEGYREELARRFRQEEMVVRATRIERL